MISQLIKTVSPFRIMKTIVTMNIMKRKHLMHSQFVLVYAKKFFWYISPTEC